ncbi:endonuclease/exonuclease/phosphatase family protein [Streptococcus merionis]|uniref:endonuclease/exonuclease/phosphatase family protein n=1 Tax=Streptococcus merionis TaxID=400065 RepID=UPI0026F175F3|nr:endonuclease/exonuclease/phosphatase family protein [Streptococcus merionis]
MKLLTVNVHAWLEEDQDEKIDILARTIAERQYDVIALQEVNQRMDAQSVGRELKKDNYGLVLLEKLRVLGVEDYSYFWSFSHIGYDIYEEGIALLTKLPVVEVDAFYCSYHQKADAILSRKTLGLTLRYQHQLIEVYSCHINLPTAEGESQLDNVQTILNRTDTGHFKLLMGDFNADAFDDVSNYQAIKELGLWDSYDLALAKDHGTTVAKAIDGWSGHFQEKRLDYLFMTEARTVQSSNVVFNGVHQPPISDHFGLEVEIDI